MASARDGAVTIRDKYGRLICVGCAHRFAKLDHAAKHLETAPLCAVCARLVLRRGYGLRGAFTLVGRA